MGPQTPLLPLLKRFIRESNSGRRLHSAGKRIRKGTLANYLFLYKLLSDFSREKKIELRIRPHARLKNRERKREAKYWQDFFDKFTAYLYDDLGHFDNYVGLQLKQLRTFFNYLEKEKGLAAGGYHRKFHSPKEDIGITVLGRERLQFLIYNKAFEQSLPPALLKAKDIFIIGCLTALRYSDLMALRRSNLERSGKGQYLVIRSQKTQVITRVKLPGYAEAIMEKYSKKSSRLLPCYSKARLNLLLKKLGERAGWTEPVMKIRMRRGQPVSLYRDGKKKASYRFCDLITTHTMRRTAITTMLTLGMSDHLVRQISGHAPGSKEFHRYVAFSQSYLDTEIDRVHKGLSMQEP